MGKYNFSAGKFDEILQRLEALERSNEQIKAKNQELANENAQLKAALAIKPQSQYGVKQRMLIPLMDREKYNYLFNYDVDVVTGDIIKATEERKAINFQNLQRYVFQVLKPVGRTTNGQKNKFYLKYPNMYELNEIEWECAVDAMKLILDDLYMCKKTLNNEKITDKEVQK